MIVPELDSLSDSLQDVFKGEKQVQEPADVSAESAGQNESQRQMMLQRD